MEPRAFAARLADDLAETLGPNLVGVYLHGSLALSCFNPARSDVDVLVVSTRELASEARRRLVELLLHRSGNPYPIELSVLTEADLKPWRYPTPYDFHFGESLRPKLLQELARGSLTLPAGPDTDLAGHIGLLRERGEVLAGPPIDEVFPPVPEADFLHSILSDLQWIRKPETRMGGRIYGVLNACRVLAYLRGAGILSKREAADWGLDALPESVRPILESSLAAYREGGDEPLSPAEARSFVAAATELVEAELVRRRPEGG